MATSRVLAGLDQELLAAKVGLSPSTVSKLEQGRKNVRMGTLRAVQDVLERLGVDVTQNGRTGYHAFGTSYA